MYEWKRGKERNPELPFGQSLRTESHHFESLNWLSSSCRSSQVRHRDPGKGNERDMSSSFSTKTHHPKAKHWTPAAPEELLHGQPYKITLELGSSRACVFVRTCLMCDPYSSDSPPAISAEESWGNARVSFCYTRHSSGSFTPRLFIQVWKSNMTIRAPVVCGHQRFSVKSALTNSNNINKCPHICCSWH